MNWGSSWDKVPFKEGEYVVLTTTNFMSDGSVESLYHVGQLAVKEKGWGWTVIHLPTMSSIAKAIPPGNHTKKGLIAWCKKVQEVCAAEWEIMNKLTPKTYDDVSKEVDKVKDKLLDYCLSIKVEE